MATTKNYRDLALEQLPMMGEYLLYYNNILFGGLYDERLLIKKVESNKRFNLKEVIPYKNAKPMYYIEEIENDELLKEIIEETCKELPQKK